jgi:4'-phosphopantetheinyl transferase EntD
LNGSLKAAPFELDLGPAVVCAGFLVVDHEAIIAELGALQVEGMPTRAVPKRRAEFLAGRLAARTALGALGFDAVPTRQEDGSPKWPEQVTGSISHGAERALCAVARVAEVRGIGIDTERLMGEAASAELRARICSDAERAVLARGIAAPEHHLVTFAFSAKESLYKCLYPLMGRFMDFSAARVVAAEARSAGAQLVGELTLELSVDWSDELRRGERLLARFAASEWHVESAVLLRA